MTALLVAVGAGLGAALRYTGATLLDRRWPWGTLLVNVVGSGLLGGFAGLAVSGAWWALLGVGLCGGLTTCSGLAAQVHALGWRRGTPYAVATVVASLTACALGFRLVG